MFAPVGAFCGGAHCFQHTDYLNIEFGPRSWRISRFEGVEVMLKVTTKLLCAAVALSFMVGFAPVTIATAAELEGEPVQLLSARTETSYPNDDVDVSYVVDTASNSFIALVSDRKTGEILESVYRDARYSDRGAASHARRGLC